MGPIDHLQAMTMIQAASRCYWSPVAMVCYIGTASKLCFEWVCQIAAECLDIDVLITSLHRQGQGLDLQVVTVQSSML